MLIAGAIASVATAGITSGMSSWVLRGLVHAAVQTGVAAIGGADRKTLAQMALISFAGGALMGGPKSGAGGNLMRQAMLAGTGTLISQIGMTYGSEKQRTTWLVLGGAMGAAAGGSARAAANILKTLLIQQYAKSQDGGTERERLRKGMVLSAWGDLAGNALNAFMTKTAIGLALTGLGQKVDTKLSELKDNLTGRTAKMQEMVELFGPGAEAAREIPHEELRSRYEKLKTTLGTDPSQVKSFVDGAGRKVEAPKGLLLKLDDATGAISLSEPMELSPATLPGKLQPKEGPVRLLQGTFENKNGALALKEGVLDAGGKLIYLTEKGDYAPVADMAKNVARLGRAAAQAAANGEELAGDLAKSAAVTTTLLTTYFKNTGQDMTAGLGGASNDLAAYGKKAAALEQSTARLEAALVQSDFKTVYETLPVVQRQQKEISRLENQLGAKIGELKDFAAALTALQQTSGNLLPMVNQDVFQSAPTQDQVTENTLKHFTDEKHTLNAQTKKTLTQLAVLVDKGIIHPQVAAKWGEALVLSHDRLMAATPNTAGYHVKEGAAQFANKPLSSGKEVLDFGMQKVIFDDWAKMAETNPTLTQNFAYAGMIGSGVYAGLAVVTWAVQGGAFLLTQPLVAIGSVGAGKAAGYGLEKAGLEKEGADFWGGIFGGIGFGAAASQVKVMRAGPTWAKTAGRWMETNFNNAMKASILTKAPAGVPSRVDLSKLSEAELLAYRQKTAGGGVLRMEEKAAAGTFRQKAGEVALDTLLDVNPVKNRITSAAQDETKRRAVEWTPTTTNTVKQMADWAMDLVAMPFKPAQWLYGW
jgi:hypothetical protein